MHNKQENLAPLQEICCKICLNIPETYTWQLDPDRNMAVIVLNNADPELALFPLFKEFSHHWSFSSTPPETEEIINWVNDRFGLLPGQLIFTSNPICNLVLYVAWWPWGIARKISMRVSLIPLKRARMSDDEISAYRQRWLEISSSSISKTGINK